MFHLSLGWLYLYRTVQYPDLRKTARSRLFVVAAYVPSRCGFSWQPWGSAPAIDRDIDLDGFVHQYHTVCPQAIKAGERERGGGGQEEQRLQELLLRAVSRLLAAPGNRIQPVQHLANTDEHTRKSALPRRY